jgi:rRNA maturation RNase YbeY
MKIEVFAPKTVHPVRKSNRVRLSRPNLAGCGVKSLRRSVSSRKNISRKSIKLTRETSNGVNRTELKRLVKLIIKKEKGGNPSLNLIFIDNRFIHRLNRKFLKKNRPTNVLAFAGEGDFLGEIYISTEYAKKEAQECGIDFKTEIDRLVIHGLLHLLGYTHKSMKTKEKQYIRCGE